MINLWKMYFKILCKFKLKIFLIANDKDSWNPTMNFQVLLIVNLLKIICLQNTYNVFEEAVLCIKKKQQQINGL